jgi:hypothetical protein
MNNHIHDNGECYPTGFNLDPNDEYSSVRLCPFCLLMTWHVHVCHHEHDPTSQSA